MFLTPHGKNSTYHPQVGAVIDKPLHETSPYKIRSGKFRIQLLTHRQTKFLAPSLDTRLAPKSGAPFSISFFIRHKRNYTTWHLWLKEKWTTILSTFQSYFDSITAPKHALNISNHPVVSFPCSTESIGLKTENYSLLYFLYSTVISALITSTASIIHLLRRGNICPSCKHQFLCKMVLFSAQKQAEKVTCKWGN